MRKAVELERVAGDLSSDDAPVIVEGGGTPV